MKNKAFAYGLLIALSIGHAGAGNFPGSIADYRRGDFAAALSGLTPLAQNGDASSQYFVGLMHLNGQGVPKDETQAFRWFEKSARQGYAKAQNALGELYFHARGTPRDDAQARFWFQKAADQRLAAAQRNLGEIYAYAVIPHDYKKAVFWMKKAAAQGDEIDQLLLANLYHYQREVQDDAKSAYWMRKSARQGVADAQNALGNAYRMGRGLRQDDGKALYWYKQAYSQGHAAAPLSIAQMHGRGEGVPSDHSLATGWFCAAAKQGNPNAVYELQQAGPQATACLIDMANDGSLLAQEELGRFYENIAGDVHDYPLAVFWSRKAAERGSASALNRLGDLYARGNGVRTDPVIAQMLYILARSRIAGTQHSSRIRSALSAPQMEEAQRLADGWKEGTPLPERSETGDGTNPSMH